MFQFTGLAATRLWIQRVLIQESQDQHSFVSSPGLFADFHALHRLLTPRHPPCALRSLTTSIQSSQTNPALHQERRAPSTAPERVFQRSIEDAIYLQTKLPKNKSPPFRRPLAAKSAAKGSDYNSPTQDCQTLLGQRIPPPGRRNWNPWPGCDRISSPR